MTSQQIAAEIEKLRTLANRDQFNPALWMPLWEIAYQLAVHNEQAPAEQFPSAETIVLRRIYGIATRELAEPPDKSDTGALVRICTEIESLGTQDASSPKTEPGTPEVTKR